MSGKRSNKWSSELAYAVGLLATDGCLSSDKRHITMRSSEIEQLKNFKKCLGINNIIGSTKDTHSSSFRVQFGNVSFYKWLNSIGLFSAKTYLIGKINIPDKYFRDFLRGHLDGDGSITTYTDFYNTRIKSKYVYKRLWLRFISASKCHIEWLQQTIIRLFNVTGRIHEIKPKIKGRTNMYILKFGKKESIQLLSNIYYSDAVICLSRKRKVAQQFITK